MMSSKMGSFIPTNPFPLPPTPHAIFTNLWRDLATTQPSNTSAFDTGVDTRDNGVCVVCGFNDSALVEHCHIIPESERDTWQLMRASGYIPSQAKSVQHESRNGILLCTRHHTAFEKYRFYIRWDSGTNEFIVINHSRMKAYEDIHGNVLHFNTATKRCPFPTAFLWHESRVRGFYPTYDNRPVTIKSKVGDPCKHGEPGIDGTLAGAQTSNKYVGKVREVDIGQSNEAHNAHSDELDNIDGNTFTPRPLTGENLAAWLKAARQHSSWTSCIIENTSWEGTAEENIEKYKREVRDACEE